MEPQKPLQHPDPVSLLFRIFPYLETLCLIPSLTALVLLRYKLGYRIMNPWVVAFAILSFMGLSSLGGLFGASDRASVAVHYIAQAVFIIAVIVMSIIHRRIGRVLIFNTTNPWHTMSRGLSHLSRVIPLREHIIQRFIEPCVTMLVGFAFIAIHVTFLGWWLVFSGMALAALEELIQQKAENDLLDRHDIRVEAIQVKADDTVIKSGGKAENRSLQSSGGIRMTASTEIARLIADKTERSTMPPVRSPALYAVSEPALEVQTNGVR